MPEYIRPDLAGIDPGELSDYLLDNGIHAQTFASPDGLHITTDADATALLAAFVPASTMDRANPMSSTYLPRVPSSAAVATHLQHLKDFRTAIRTNATPAPTLAQTQHALADVIDALRLLDARLDRTV